MATTSIWDVNDNLKRVIDYISNPEKTNNQDFSEFEYRGLENVLEYDMNDFKTEKQLYVSGLNCDPSTALTEMTATKVKYSKTDGKLAFHGYQSFAPGEVTAETAHQIGVELAGTLWGDRFEVVVSTHLDKAHFHNHFCINSVSFKDGKRYYDNKSTYKLMRLESDRLCVKYNLSVIKNPQKGKGWHYAEWQADRMHRPTWRSVIREDVDYAISQSLTFQQFIRVLESLGYQTKTNVKHIAVKPPGMERFVRLRSLTRDGQYDEEHINERIVQNVFINYDEEPSRIVKKFHYQGDLIKARKLTGLKALYFKYLYMMGILPKNAPNRKRVHFYFKEDLRYMDKITKEVTMMCKNNISSIEDLDKRKVDTEQRLEKLIRERRCYYNKLKRCRDPEFREKIQKDIDTLSSEIKELRKEVVLCDDIRSRSSVMKEKIKKVYEEKAQRENENKEVEKDERRWRNSRSGG